MRYSKLLGCFLKAGLVLAVCLITVARVSAQAPAAARDAKEAALVDALSSLESQVRQLSVALNDVKAEAARSRAESIELRKELEETRAQLDFFQRDLSKLTAQPAAGIALAPPAAAGGGATVSQTSATHARLDRLEEDQQLLGSQVNTQDQTKVESGSKFRVRLSGIALMNVFSNRGTVNNADVPFLAVNPVASGTNATFGATLRQSLLGLEVYGPDLAGARTSAQVQFDFFGGFPAAPDGITAGIVRLRTATARLDWPRTSIVVGQDGPFFSPLSPSSLASLGYPALSYAGNLWTWTPQVRVERHWSLPGDSSLLVQGGFLDPLTGEPPYDPFYLLPQAGQRAGQPAYASRVAWSHNAFGRPLTVGGGGYYGRQNWGFGRTVNAWAGTADWSLPLSKLFSLTGEVYRGRAIGGLGGGEGRSVLFSGDPALPTTSVTGLNAAGGWAQLKFAPTEKLEFNGAFGEDYPFASDLRRFPAALSYFDPSTGRNQSTFVNSIYHLRSNLLLSLEYRRLWTSDLYTPRDKANQVNLGVAALF